MKTGAEKMWCLVSQPNSVILEVEVDPKARGQECLEKVCETLGISKESDYFGLKYTSPKGEELWLNLRNPIDRQVPGIHPYRFALRVKFWVPPHLLLQETTRHQFFLHVRLDLLTCRLKTADYAVIPRLAALVTQAELGDYDAASTAQADYLEQCCVLGANDHNKPAELARRIVSLHKEMKGMKSSTAEYWLLKEVSSFANFGQETFVTKVANGMSEGVGVGPTGLTVYQNDTEIQSIPYTAVQSASSHRRSFHLHYVGGDGSDAALDLKLDSSQAASGLYRAITEKHAFYSCETVRLAVTTQFIRDLKIDSQYTRRIFHALEPVGCSRPCPSEPETLREAENEMDSQYTLRFGIRRAQPTGSKALGTIASIFNEDTSFGKKYVFDIRRTCREVYDNARRALYQTAELRPPADDEGVAVRGINGCGCTDTQCKESRQRLARLTEAMVCRVCMDRQIDTAFFPCAHVMTCSACAARCERCPLCRAAIDQSHRIYLPTELTPCAVNQRNAC